MVTDGVGIEFNTSRVTTRSNHRQTHKFSRPYVEQSQQAADLVFGLGYAESYGAAQHTNFCVCVSLLSNPLYV